MTTPTGKSVEEMDIPELEIEKLRLLSEIENLRFQLRTRTEQRDEAIRTILNLAGDNYKQDKERRRQVGEIHQAFNDWHRRASFALNKLLHEYRLAKARISQLSRERDIGRAKFVEMNYQDTSDQLLAELYDAFVRVTRITTIELPEDIKLVLLRTRRHLAQHGTEES